MPVLFGLALVATAVASLGAPLLAAALALAVLLAWREHAPRPGS